MEEIPVDYLAEEAQGRLDRLSNLFNDIPVFFYLIIGFVFIAVISFGINYLCRQQTSTYGEYLLAIGSGLSTSIGTYLGLCFLRRRSMDPVPLTVTVYIINGAFIGIPGFVIGALSYVNLKNKAGAGNKNNGSAIVAFGFCFLIIMGIFNLLFLHRATGFVYRMLFVMMMGYSLPIFADWGETNVA